MRTWHTLCVCVCVHVHVHLRFLRNNVLHNSWKELRAVFTFSYHLCVCMCVCVCVCVRERERERESESEWRTKEYYKQVQVSTHIRISHMNLRQLNNLLVSFSKH